MPSKETVSKLNHYHHEEEMRQLGDRMLDGVRDDADAFMEL